MFLRLLIFISVSFFAKGQIKSADILMKSIKIHDSNQRWKKLKVDLEMSIIRDKTADRFFKVGLNLPQNSFFYEVKNDSLHSFQGFKGDVFAATLNGKSTLNESEIKKYDLGKIRTQYLKEVYEYLLLLPMRLENDLHLLNPEFTEEVFNQKTCYKLTIQYLPSEENETWHFFIDKETFILHGYQFFLKDKKTNGEYIFLEDYTTIKGILIPKIKRWYWNKDDSFFRKDTIIKSF